VAAALERRGQTPGLAALACAVRTLEGDESTSDPRLLHGAKSTPANPPAVSRPPPAGSSGTAVAAMNLLKIGEIGTRLDALERAHKTGEDPDPTGGLDGGLLGEPRLRPPSGGWRNSKGPSRPTKLVLSWLDEAHAFGDLESYVPWLLDRGSLRGRSRRDVDAAVRTAVGETVVRFELVLRINTLAHETIEREALVHAILAGRLAPPAPSMG
jgi:hypothetical protein